jgi:hypothetical protein
MEYGFEGIKRPSTNDCIVWVFHVNDVKHNLFRPCVVDITEGNLHCHFAKCHNLSSSEATKRVCCIMYLVLWLLHLSEGLCEDDVCCTACINQNIVDQESLDDTRYNHSIIVRIVFKLKVFLGESNWYVRPLGSDEGSLHPNMLHSYLRFLLLLLIG